MQYEYGPVKFSLAALCIEKVEKLQFSVRRLQIFNGGDAAFSKFKVCL